MSIRPTVSFIAWTPIQGRSAEIAQALGGEAHCVFDRRFTRRRYVPFRYFLSAIETVRYLWDRRPLAIIVTNPPLIPGYLAVAYGAITGAPVVLDTHPGGFGAQGDRVSGRLQLAHRWLARRATACMVTDAFWVDKLEAWGAKGLVFHEAPPLWSVGPARAIDGTPKVLFVGTFGGDEPVDVVFEAARLCPEIEIRVTGDPKRCAPELLVGLATNVVLTGFLGHDDYAKAVDEADIVLTLSTEPTSVMRAAYEAVSAGRPLVLSDWPGLRSLFPYALRSANEPEALASAIRRAVAEHDRLRAEAGAARALQDVRWKQQLDDLRGHLGLAPGQGEPPDIRVPDRP